MKVILPVIIFVAIISFVIGANVKNSFISPFNLALDKDELAQESADEIAAEKANLPTLSGESAPAASARQNNQGYTVKTDGDKIVFSGDFSYSSYKIIFTINAPKAGGDITGSIGGSCEGTINGKAEKPNAEGFAPIQGKYSGECKPVPGLGFKTPASGEFEGKISYKDGRVGINYTNKKPLEKTGYFELSF